MKIIDYLEDNYYKICQVKNDNYEVKINKIMEILRDVTKFQGVIQSSSLEKYLIELRKVTSLLNEIRWSDKTQQQKENLLEHCKLMIEVHLGQALILEMESDKRQCYQRIK